MEFKSIPNPTKQIHKRIQIPPNPNPYMKSNSFLFISTNQTDPKNLQFECNDIQFENIKKCSSDAMIHSYLMYYLEIHHIYICGNRRLSPSAYHRCETLSTSRVTPYSLQVCIHQANNQYALARRKANILQGRIDH